jgi:hypothetical protein
MKRKLIKDGVLEFYCFGFIVFFGVVGDFLLEENVW